MIVADRSLSRGVAGMSIITLAMVAVLVALGLWQLQRKEEKRALIAALTQRLGDQPVALPPKSDWQKLTAEHDEFRRVKFQASLDVKSGSKVYTSGSALRPDVTRPGVWAFAPGHLASGDTIAINRGFVADDAQYDDASVPH